MSVETEPDQDQSQPGDPYYSFKSSLMGAPSQFALRPDALQWQIGRRTGSIPYNRIRRIRMSYRPATMQSHRFITELHRRLAAAGTKADLWSGTPALLYWPGIVVFAGVTVTVLVLATRSMLRGDWTGTGILAVILAVFLYQLGNFFRRNRPRRYRADAVPAETLPSAPG
jgi:hypothetical protein